MVHGGLLVCRARGTRSAHANFQAHLVAHYMTMQDVSSGRDDSGPHAPFTVSLSPYNSLQARLALRGLLDDTLAGLPFLRPLTSPGEHPRSPRSWT